MSAPNELADLCESAEGPSRELDMLIGKLVGRIASHAKWMPERGEPDIAWSGGFGSTVPAYTASIDAAMTLVPEGAGRGCFAMNRDRFGKTHCDVWYDAEFNRKAHASAKTPALALCAAFLRANGGEHGRG